MTYQPVHTCRQYRLLITGSRNASPEMLDVASQAVAHAKANGWMILVGDNPDGVDAAVIDACDELGVNMMVFGISKYPRKESQRDDTYWQVDLKRSDDDEEKATFAGYATRDRYMVDLSDRVFAIWNGSSKGTKAGYDYAVQSGKLADIRTFKVEPTHTKMLPEPWTPPVLPRPTASPTVELVVDVHKLGNVQMYEGTFGLRALDASGKLLSTTRQVIEITAKTTDGALMQTILHGLKHLVAHLKSETASYQLHIYQSSKNVDRWLGHHWKRNDYEVQRLGRQIDKLMLRFPATTWINEPHAQLLSRLSKIVKVSDVR